MGTNDEHFNLCAAVYPHRAADFDPEVISRPIYFPEIADIAAQPPSIIAVASKASPSSTRRPGAAEWG
jgi:hypothetical protein